MSAIAQQLLDAEGVPASKGWASLVAELASAAAGALSLPALTATANTDPRCHIQVKRILGPHNASDSVMIDGIVLEKSVLHKRMRTDVQQPRILALGGALEYARPSSKLSSFDALIEQEKEYLRGVVNRLLEVQPDVLLVERGIARYAQDLLLEAGVSVVINVQPDLLQRIVQCTGGQMVGPAEAVGAQCVGACKVFQMIAIPAYPESSSQTGDAGLAADHDPPEGQSLATSKSFIMLRGLPHKLAATILLYGDNVDELAKVERVTAFATYAAHWNRLEATFLSAQLAAAALCLGIEGVGDAAADVVRNSLAAVAANRGTEFITSASPHVSTYCEPGLGLADLAPANADQQPQRSQATLAGVQEAFTAGVSQPNSKSDGSSDAGRQDLSGQTESVSGRLGGVVQMPVSPRGRIYDTQQLWLSISCRNPAKGVLCEPPHVHSMPFYQQSGTQSTGTECSMHCAVPWPQLTHLSLCLQTCHCWTSSLQPHQCNASVPTPSVGMEQHSICAAFCMAMASSHCPVSACHLGRSFLPTRAERRFGSG